MTEINDSNGSDVALNDTKFDNDEDVGPIHRQPFMSDEDLIDFRLLTEIPVSYSGRTSSNQFGSHFVGPNDENKPSYDLLQEFDPYYGAMSGRFSPQRGSPSNLVGRYLSQTLSHSEQTSLGHHYNTLATHQPSIVMGHRVSPPTAEGRGAIAKVMPALEESAPMQFPLMVPERRGRIPRANVALVAISQDHKSIRNRTFELLKDRGYKVIRTLGSGENGEVFEAVCDHKVSVWLPLEDQENICDFDFDDFSEERNCFVKRINLGGQRCAIKSVFSNIRAIKESRVMMALNHPNVIQIYESFETEGNYCIVMELCNGSSDLEAYLKHVKSLNKQLDQFTGLLIIKHITHALQYIHSMGYAHQDLHRGNVMSHVQDNKLIWKVLDFGWAEKEGDPFYQPEKDFDRLASMIGIVSDQTNFSIQITEAINEVIEKIKNRQFNNMEEIADRLLLLMPITDDPEDGSAAQHIVELFNETMKN